MSTHFAVIGDTRMTRRVAVGLLVAAAMLPLAGVARAQATPTLAVVSPADGATITANDIAVQVKVSDLQLDCAAFGRPDQSGVGEVLAFVDGATIAQLTNFYCAETFTIAGEGLTPGQHTLTFVLASSTHVPMLETAQQITIDFAPPAPAPLPAAHYTGAPSVTLVSPQDGATVPAAFPVQLTPEHFTPQAGLEGKPNVAGFGHYHVWVDAAAPHASLAGLVLMPGDNEFTLDLSAWGPGEHTVRIEPTQNDHTGYDPATPVAFTVTVSDTATPAASPVAAAPVAIHMTSALQFDPPDATIRVGQTVTWVNDSASSTPPPMTRPGTRRRR